MINPALKEKCLNLIARFEGGWDGVAGNFDGQVMSFGPLQWNFGQGTLNGVFADLARTAPSVLSTHLGTDFLRAAQMGRCQGFVQTYCLLGTGIKWSWQQKFKALARTPECRAAFLRGAASYFAIAEQTCLRYGLKSERAFAWAFDRAVQQGGKVRPLVGAAVRAAQLTRKAEYDVLKFAGRAYAQTATARWRNDVLDRTLSLALGGTAQSGRLVHGGSFDLERDYGISYERPWAVTGAEQ